ncbi:MAG: hypothetical protein RIM23_23385 [Coleofasciculus sp. G3-WIS-01]|uniref:hypothetical protein n=1 Tax=Coleofasciculus sp. G3-WIS-01 TaxID=3069528 RepID=UPI0032F2F78F
MAPNPKIMNSVEQLGYRVTVGDVAAKAGLNINLAERGLLALASDAGGHLQVAESGEIAYLFPKNFRTILRNKFIRLRLQEWWAKTWRILFYLIRVSFGLLLLLSIVLIFLAISIIVISISSSSDNDSGGGSNGGSNRGGGMIFMPHFWIGPDMFWFFDPGYERHRQRRTSWNSNQSQQMNFLEAIFSFLFGDGNPNADLEERRWQEIGTVIRNSGGAVTAEQIAPYLDDIGTGYQREYEDYMLPVLSRFNGRPEVSPDGEIIYHFPDLQTTAQQQHPQPVSSYLQEQPWRFSAATSGQIMLAIGLGGVNIVGAFMLGSLLRGGEIAAEIGGLVAFVASIYWFLLGYGIGFLAIPLIRYFWIQQKNSKIAARNQKRQQEALALAQPDADLQKKLAYAQQFAAQNVIGQEDLVYTSEQDLLDQNLQRKDQIDAEWQRRLDSGS